MLSGCISFSENIIDLCTNLGFKKVALGLVALVWIFIKHHMGPEKHQLNIKVQKTEIE